jgi:D-sedoheptulose 7-phosphate isomerase
MPPADIVRTAAGRQTLDWLLTELAEQRRAGRRIVTTNGCFDLIHPGHVAFLNEARGLGDLLVVLLNSDKSVQQLKGPTRPILNQEERAAILLGLRSVDFVVLFDDLLPVDTLAAIQPQIHCKASDYVASELPEAAVVEKFGGNTKILPHVSGYSSSQIAERVLTKSTAAPQELSGPTSDSANDVYRLMLAGSNVLRQTAWKLRTDLIAAADMMSAALHNKHKILVCGNGGSAADAQHFVAELVGRYRIERQPWPAIALTVDTSILTSVGNDYGFDQIFSRQVSALGTEGDVLLAISTSGKSPNILNAIDAANRLGIKTIGLSGYADSPLAQTVQLSLQVASTETSLIQQAHIAVLHVICELLEGHCDPKGVPAVSNS